MQTVTVDILNEKAYRLLEDLGVIKLHRPSTSIPKEGTGLSKLRGSIQTGLTVDEIDARLRNMRDEWERE